MRKPGARERGGPLRERAARAIARPFFLLLLGLARVLPRPMLRRLATGSSRLVYIFFPGVRAGLLSNAAMILGPGSSPRARGKLARRVLASFARFLVDLVSPARSGPTQDLARDTSGREHFEAARAAGKGIIAATLHMGNYELASLEIAALQGNAAVVYNRERIGFLEVLRSRRRREKRLDEIVIDDSMFFAIEALDRLRGGGMVLLSGDQVAARDGERFPFLHGTAPFSLWPARLSIASGAPILPAFNVLGPDGRYHLRLEEPILPGEGADPWVLTRQLVQVYERYVREHGDQWLMIRRFWD